MIANEVSRIVVDRASWVTIAKNEQDSILKSPLTNRNHENLT